MSIPKCLLNKLEINTILGSASFGFFYKVMNVSILCISILKTRLKWDIEKHYHEINNNIGSPKNVVLDFIVSVGIFEILVNLFYYLKSYKFSWYYFRLRLNYKNNEWKCKFFIIWIRIGLYIFQILFQRFLLCLFIPLYIFKYRKKD
jgi:hypothetical protein